jgi:hypothetical protein
MESATITVTPRRSVESCPACFNDLEVEGFGRVACGICGHHFEPFPSPPIIPRAHIAYANGNTFFAAVLIALGVLFLPVLVGVVLIWLGVRTGRGIYRCSHCGNRLPDCLVRMCPCCHSTFTT